MYCKEAWMDMQNRTPSLGDMDMAGQLCRMNTQDMEKEMEPKFKVGDKVVTKRGVFSEVISITEDWVQTRSYRTGLTFLWSRRHDKKLRHANIYDEAGAQWRVTCVLNRLTENMNRPYMESVAPPLRHRELWTQDVVNRFEDFIEGIKEKEMEPKFKVGDVVSTLNGELVTVVQLEAESIRDITQVRMVPSGQEAVFLTSQLRRTNIKDGTVAYEREGYKHIDYFSTMEKAVREAYQAPAQPIFRLKHVNGTSGWEGCHFVLVAEDEREMLVQEVDINEAKVRDRIVTAQKSNWTRDYSIGDEIINFLQARGGNFINKVVDNG